MLMTLLDVQMYLNQGFHKNFECNRNDTFISFIKPLFNFLQTLHYNVNDLLTLILFLFFLTI